MGALSRMISNPFDVVVAFPIETGRKSDRKRLNFDKAIPQGSMSCHQVDLDLLPIRVELFRAIGLHPFGRPEQNNPSPSRSAAEYVESATAHLACALSPDFEQ